MSSLAANDRSRNAFAERRFRRVLVAREEEGGTLAKTLRRKGRQADILYGHGE
jgi:hypothetical protein